jgi:hypothetical protein
MPRGAEAKVKDAATVPGLAASGTALACPIRRHDIVAASSTVPHLICSD